MDQGTRDMILRIELQDMKPRYQHVKYQNKRTNAFIKSLEISSGVGITFCVKECMIIEFTLKGDQGISKEAQKDVRELIQGEICSAEAVKKYDMPIQWLPHERVHQVKPSHKAWKEMTTELQEELQRQAKKVSALTLDAVEKHDRKTSGPLELRQFACAECHRSWWRTVLQTKPVSRCKGSRCGARRYDALPRKKEFGIGRCICSNQKCRRVFYVYSENRDIFDCRKCKSSAMSHVHPKWRRRQRRKKLNPDAKTFKPRKAANPPAMSPIPKEFRPKFEPIRGDLGPNFEPVSYVASPILAAPRPTIGPSLSDLAGKLSIATTPGRSSFPPKKKRIFNPSKPHDSIGSTVSTFLSQCNFDNSEYGTEVDLDYDNEIDDYVPSACRFECSYCENEYTVVCRMVDIAVCFKCQTDNSPLGRSAANEIDRKTDNKHSCSRCCDYGTCPNLQESRLARDMN